jgi:inner membrane protein involved in colicin E2 resistance
MQTPPLLTEKPKRRNAVTLKLLFIAALVLLLQMPLHLVNALRQERSQNWSHAAPALIATPAAERTAVVVEGYRMVERSLKHSVLVLTLVFTAFFLFETLVGLRLHPVHYGLVGAALCMFYLILLALGEIFEPGPAYIGATAASSLLVTFYSASVLRSRGRAAAIGALLAAVHAVLYVVLRMENYALLAGTASLFVALAAVMYFTRNVDWFAQETGKEATAP